MVVDVLNVVIFQNQYVCPPPPISHRKWKVGKKDYVLHHMVFNGWRILDEFHKDKHDEVEDTCSDDEITETLSWLGRIYKEDSTLMKRLKNDAFILMLNNKALLIQKLPECS